MEKRGPRPSSHRATCHTGFFSAEPECRRGRPAWGPSSVLTRSKLAASKVRQTHRDSGTHAAKSACEGAGRRRGQGCRENWSEARAPASAPSRGAPHPISSLDRHSKPRFMEGSSEMERRHPRIWGRGWPPTLLRVCPQGAPCLAEGKGQDDQAPSSCRMLSHVPPPHWRGA